MGRYSSVVSFCQAHAPFTGALLAVTVKVCSNALRAFGFDIG